MLGVSSLFCPVSSVFSVDPRTVFLRYSGFVASPPHNEPRNNGIHPDGMSDDMNILASEVSSLNDPLVSCIQGLDRAPLDRHVSSPEYSFVNSGPSATLAFPSDPTLYPVSDVFSHDNIWQNDFYRTHWLRTARSF